MSGFIDPKSRRGTPAICRLAPSGGRWLLLAALAIVLIDCPRSRAQEELALWLDLDIPLVEAAQQGFSDRDFESWVFQRQRTEAAARKYFNSQLMLQVDQIDRSCKLTDAQKQKLRLAGRGDVRRFFDSYEEIKKKFQSIKHDRQKANQIFQDISPLQTTMRTGLFHGGSLLHKSLRNTLTGEQFPKYAEEARQARLYRYRAKLELTVGMLEQGMPLTDEQRQKLIALLLKETKPPRKSGQYDYYYIQYQFTRLPEEKLKPLLDETQWKVFNRQLDQGRQMEQWLRQNGYLVEDQDDNEAGDELSGG